MMNHFILSARHRRKRGERTKRSNNPIRGLQHVQTPPPPLKGHGQYSIIYCDPPWQFSQASREGAANDQYPTMSMAELCELPVKTLGADNSVILMWTTAATFENAFDLMRAWGYEYTTLFLNWIKLNPQALTPGMWGGNYSRSNAEFLLLGKRGQCARLVENHEVSQLFDEHGYLVRDKEGIEALFDQDGRFQIIEASPHLGHSAKPPRVRETITRVFGDVPRIELFCRIPADSTVENDPRHAGWDVWGNQIRSLVSLSPRHFSLGSLVLRRVLQEERAAFKQTEAWDKPTSISKIVKAYRQKESKSH